MTSLINFSLSLNRLNTFPWWCAGLVLLFRLYHFWLWNQSTVFWFLPCWVVFSSCRNLVVVIKKPHYATNLKHSLQTKNAIHNVILRLNAILLYYNASFSIWLKVVKVLHHHYFCKTVFKINLISKKILKAFVKLNANSTQININLVTHYCNQNLSGLKPSATKQKMFFCAKSLLLGL